MTNSILVTPDSTRVTVEQLLSHIPDDDTDGSWGGRIGEFDKIIQALSEGEITTLARTARERWGSISHRREALRANIARELAAARQAAIAESQRAAAAGVEPDEQVMERPGKLQRRQEYAATEIEALRVMCARFQAVTERLESWRTKVTIKRVQKETAAQLKRLDSLMGEVAQVAAQVADAYLVAGLEPTSVSIFPSADAAKRGLLEQLFAVGLGHRTYQRLFGGK